MQEFIWFFIYFIYFIYITIPLCLIGCGLHFCLNGCEDTASENEIHLLDI